MTPNGVQFEPFASPNIASSIRRRGSRSMGSTRRPGGRGGDIDRRRALDLVVTGERRIHRVMRCVRKRDNGMGLLTAQVARIPHAAVLVVRRDEGCLFAVVIAEAVDD